MKVTSYDICVQGFERLRTNDEFIIGALVDNECLPENIFDDLLSDYRAVDRGDDFDWVGGERAIGKWFTQAWPDIQRGISDIDPCPEDESGEYGVNIFVYVEHKEGE